MKKITNLFLSWLVYGNIWVALAVMLMGKMSYVLLKEEEVFSSLWTLFFATLTVYNLCVFYTKSALSEKFEFIIKKRKWLTLVFIGSTCLLIPVPFFLSLNQFWYLFHLAVISVFYAVPIHLELPSGNYFSIRAWRNIPYLKIFLIGYVWASATVVFPMLQEQLFIKDTHTVALFAERFLFVIAVTIPFDIRDSHNDKQTGLPTLVSALGVIWSKIFATFLIMGALFCVWLFFPHAAWAFATTYVIALLLIWQSSSSKPEWFYTGLIDGLFVLEFVLLNWSSFLGTL